ELVGGVAHLRDCVPSKAMIATADELRRFSRAPEMGLDASSSLDIGALAARVVRIEEHLARSTLALLESQNVRVVVGRGRLRDANTIEICDVSSWAVTETVQVDAVLLSTGSRPRIPDFASVDGERVMTTRDAYPPSKIPERLVIIGSGVTGVEFTHMFSALGSDVTLVVSRQQVLPAKDPEVAAVLEEEFLRRGVTLLKGARANAIEMTTAGVVIGCEDGRTVEATNTVLAIGSIPNSEGVGAEAAGVTVDANGYLTINRHCQTNVAHIYAAGDLSGKLPLSSVAAMQGRRIAEHLMGMHSMPHTHIDYDKAASAIFTDPEVADVGLAEADAFAVGRKIRVTKVPFGVNPKALIDGDARGFVKLISDPATGVVLGGSIVGAHAAELISVVALAVNARLKTAQLVDSLFVHPSRSEAIVEASS
ncbi:MAG: NAD(P)/FAD-dependent oxidoreductase, partial [Acidimicrobiia bacterium]